MKLWQGSVISEHIEINILYVLKLRLVGKVRLKLKYALHQTLRELFVSQQDSKLKKH